MNNRKKTLICPKCAKKFLASDENKASLPFCSKRCKMIDLGKWLGEKYVVDGGVAPSTEKLADENEDMDND